MRSLLPRSPKFFACGRCKDNAGVLMWVEECGVRGSAAAARCGGAGREWARVRCGACGATEDAGSHVLRLHVALRQSARERKGAHQMPVSFIYVETQWLTYVAAAEW
jgi:hypothetical protein